MNIIFGIMVCYLVEGDDSLDSSEYSACLLLEEKSSIWVNVSWNLTKFQKYCMFDVSTF